MSRRRISYQALAGFGCFVLPTLILLSLWIPLFRHYYIPNIPVTDEMLNEARLLPSDQILKQLRGFYFFTPIPTNEPPFIATAYRLLNGDMESLGYPGETIGMPFDANDIYRLSGSRQLLLAKFAVPRIFLDAYRFSGSEEFLAMARDVILGWALYERQAWLPRGFLWHDTAVAERLLVLAEFWRFYRHHPAFDPAVARIILELAARSSAFLAEPAHFTFSSNHGIIQNLALWHFCVAFPTLPNVEQYTQLAFDRLRAQMAFYCNDEGVVLEHSAGYQELGLHFIGMALRYLSLLRLPVPEDWLQKYAKAKNFYAQLRRPDSSLPVFGDTAGSLNPEGPPIVTLDDNGQAAGVQDKSHWMPPQAFTLYPVAGYSIWWNGLAFWPRAERLAQTVVAWSNFPGHAHKHADEMSVLLWVGGQTWWANVGYWPYGSPGRAGAESWDGSSAPHLLDENVYSARTTNLRSFGWSEQLAMLELERHGPRQQRIRRQLVYLKPHHLWLVLDHFLGQGEARTSWTTAHNVSLRQGEILGSYLLQAKDVSARLTTFVLGSDNPHVNIVRGSLKPFAGWQVVDSTPQPASALVIEQPARDAWSMVVWSWDDGVTPARQFERQPYMAVWKNTEQWKIALPIKPGLLEVQRESNQLSVQDSSDVGSNNSLELTKAPDFTQEILQVRKSYAMARDQYPQLSGSFASRLKVTKLLVVLLTLQEILFFVYRKAVKKGYLIIRLCNVMGWLAIGLWLNIVKFAG
jgi:heparinase II/III-like protein